MLALGEKVAVLERFFLVFLSLGSQHGRRGTVLFTYDLILIPKEDNYEWKPWYRAELG